jgi:adenosylcobinamide-phosphate synthase
MKFLSLVVALLIEQWRPLRHNHALFDVYRGYTDAVERHTNVGDRRHGVIGWLLAVVPVVLLVMLTSWLLYRLTPLAAWTFNVAVLYLTMGFRQFSHYYGEIQTALRNDNLAEARRNLGLWRGQGAEEFTPTEVARVAIEQGLIGGHRHVFGPIAWFLVLGPAGAVLYRAAILLGEKWGHRADPAFGQYGEFAARMLFWIDWLPARLTAASFAIVGNFEDAIYCWRTQALSWAARANGVILASGGGALGVRLGDAIHEYGEMHYRPELGTGDEADLDYMQSATGLMWRALVLWLFLIFIVSIAHSLG